MRRAVTFLALGLALAGCDSGHSRSDSGGPTVATYSDCPDIEIDGKLYPLGDSCQFVEGELVAVHMKGGWVTAE